MDAGQDEKKKEASAAFSIIAFSSSALQTSAV